MEAGWRAILRSRSITRTLREVVRGTGYPDGNITYEIWEVLFASGRIPGGRAMIPRKIDASFTILQLESKSVENNRKVGN